MQQKDKKTIRDSEPEQGRKPLSSDKDISHFPETEGEGRDSTTKPSDDSAPSASSVESKSAPDENRQKNAPVVDKESEAVDEGKEGAREEEAKRVFPAADAKAGLKAGEKGRFGTEENASVEEDRRQNPADKAAGPEESLTDWGQGDPFAPPEELRKDEEKATESQSSPAEGASDEGRPYRKPAGVLKWTKKESDVAGKQPETEPATTTTPEKKRRFRLNRKQGLMFVFVWLPLLSVAALAGGLMIGYSVLGNDPVGEVFTRELWEHLYNLIYG